MSATDRALAIAILAATGLAPSIARADEPSAGGPIVPKKAAEAPAPKRDLEWNPKWPKVQTYEYVLTGVYAIGAVAAVAIPGAPRWTAKNGFDDAARGALRLVDFEDQTRAKDASDVGLVLLVNHVLVDNLFVTWWGRQHPNIAWQLSVIDAETLAFTASVNSLVAGIVGRQRPYVDALCSLPGQADQSACNGNNQYRSFFSGHATAAFTLAGLTCIHHAELPLYGGGAPDAIACAGAMATASTVALLRVVSDQHYLSDVLVGAAFGTAGGIGLPWLLHYRGGAKLETAEKRSALAPSMMVMANPGGMTLFGAF